jgi:hypothetical protein
MVTEAVPALATLAAGNRSGKMLTVHKGGREGRAIEIDRRAGNESRAAGVQREASAARRNGGRHQRLIQERDRIPRRSSGVDLNA